MDSITVLGSVAASSLAIGTIMMLDRAMGKKKAVSGKVKDVFVRGVSTMTMNVELSPYAIISSANVAEVCFMIVESDKGSYTFTDVPVRIRKAVAIGDQVEIDYSGIPYVDRKILRLDILRADGSGEISRTNVYPGKA